MGLILAALICHFLFYVVPGMLGMKTGLPLYIVGTSTYGVYGGFLMPGFLMGVLQFGWLAVNAFFAGTLLCARSSRGRERRHMIVVAAVGDCRRLHGAQGYSIRGAGRHVPSDYSVRHFGGVVRGHDGRHWPVRSRRL